MPSCIVPLRDSISKYYFDKRPFRPYGYCGEYCCYKEPKLEVLKGGCMCCCVHLNPGPPCFDPKGAVVLMPYERASFPCCCVANRVNFNENCFGLCGPPTGNPKVYEMLPLQPKNPEAFVEASCKQLGTTCMRAHHTIEHALTDWLTALYNHRAIPESINWAARLTHAPLLTLACPCARSELTDTPGMQEMNRGGGGGQEGL